MSRYNLNQNQKIIFYKLLHDALFVLLILFALALIGEGLLPGIVSSHLGVYKIALMVLAITLAINLLAHNLKLAADKKINKKTALPLGIVAAALVFNGLFRLSPYISLPILVITILISFFLYKIFFVSGK